MGLWCGPSLAVALNYVVYMFYINKADWNKIANDHEEKMRKVNEKMTPTPAREKE